MKFYPAFLDVRDRRCLVVGTGPIGERKAKRLYHSGAQVELLGPDAPATSPWAATTHKRPYSPSDLENCWLVVAATGDAILNARIADDCESRRIFCNVVTDGPRSSYIVPTIVDRSPLLVAISTGGTSPILARLLKTKLESLIPAAYARLAERVGDYREVVKQSIPDNAKRAAFWYRLLNGTVGELAFSHDGQRLGQAIDEAIARHREEEPASIGAAHVALVGAGPGDPDLLTFRALRLIQSADVIVYDRLVSEAILNLARADAELVYAGKARAAHSMPQESINDLLVRLASDGRLVVRLKGGDPFIFGRGGEEIETLATAGVSFQVVPGITAASGCAAFSGIPLTHRDHAQSCVFVTGHLSSGTINLNWNDLRDPTQTIVVYMGLVGLSEICRKLISVGRPKNTPAALVEQGTTPSQRVIVADLETLSERVDRANVSAPTLLIIGGVVRLHKKLDWFGTGRRV